MATVTVTIDGKAIRMGCEPGEEARIETLAAYLDGKIGMLRESFGEIGDLRLAIMAALTICDELHEARDAVGRLQSDLDRLADARDHVASHAEARDAEVAQAVDQLSARVERIGALLSGQGQV